MPAESAPGLTQALDLAFQALAGGVTDRRSPFHTPALATVARDGAPSLRTVILRAFDPATRRLRIHTDSRSPKTAELRAEPRAALLAYDPATHTQLRLAGRVTLHDCDAIAEDAWVTSRESSRMTYAAALAPGAPLPAPLAGPDDPQAGRIHFVAVVMTIDCLDWLLLDPAGHRRARFTWDETGAMRASWIAP
ncbi:pyridoxamine 5'-phosphate oxidase family protein [Roseomonas sp. HJA6]|uniref:Pyridoxamine 5'-phosphate oxidase family protein n=1 Tax=Roseomonas alba TaxID=2846776 RepID=A0ABS7A638_9PROT|nr:pyridoxamine 5'-phosphate oxidase family protein [Neoroseomonas alba]MBW6397769.1 pyridoxamine 5'-phosphate oxidase family protein [Neoroseomonas alba]